MSTPFKVTRRVRQEDPMSCLLFSIAIEFLAQLLQCSKLKGFKIHDQTEKLIATLFVDNTTVYLLERDRFKDLKKILTK